jgi:hypothetical protein
MIIERLSTLCDDTPNLVLASMVSAAVSTCTLIGSGLMAMLGQVPTPTEAGMWPFYGVLIVAVITLFCSLAYVIRWMMTTGVGAIASVKEAVAVLSTSNESVREALEKQSAFFDSIGKDAIRQSLTQHYSKP